MVTKNTVLVVRNLEVHDPSCDRATQRSSAVLRGRITGKIHPMRERRSAESWAYWAEGSARPLG